MHNIGKTLSFDRKFIENAMNELLENKYLGNEPPVFSQKQYAEAFLRDAIKLACVDNEVASKEFDWLQSIAVSNGLSNEWLKNELEDYLSGKHAHESQELEIKKYLILYRIFENLSSGENRTGRNLQKKKQSQAKKSDTVIRSK